MSKKFIPVEELFDEWHKDPEYMKEYDALEEEFALANALIRARADLSQAELAKRMGTSQSAIARLESGRVAALDADAAQVRRGDGDEAAVCVRAGEAGEGGIVVPGTSRRTCDRGSEQTLQYGLCVCS